MAFGIFGRATILKAVRVHVSTESIVVPTPGVVIFLFTKTKSDAVHPFVKLVAVTL